MPWAYIYKLLGFKSHWNQSQDALLAAIAKAERDGQFAAADHIRIILEMRNVVHFETPKKEPRTRRG
jgi:hypothetical protein